MNTDRELLETAAKAANFTVTWAGDNPPYPRATLDGHWNPTWNPLENDGDALRLAVKLEIDLCFGANYVIADGVQQPTVNNANDPYLAVRYAIVRAAAELAPPAVGAV